MNRIYKVIWNKTRGMYMVVSELAKGQSKDGRRAVGRKKVAQTAAALAVFFSIVSMGGTTFAADTTKVESSTSDTAVEVYTKDGTDAQIEAARKYTYRKTAELDQKLTDQKTSTALHISSTGDLIVGTKENQTVKDMEIRGKLTSGSLSTGDITSTGDVTVTGKVAADGVTDETTKDGTYIKQNNTVGNNLVSLDKQVKANDDRITAVKEYLQKEAADTYVSKNDAAVQDGAIVKAANTIGDNMTKLDAALAKETAARLGADAAQDKVIQQVNKNASQGIATLATAYQNEAAAREAKDNELNERITNEANEIHKTTNQLQTDLNKETADRKTADNELNERITNEANAIHETTKQLQTDLNTETTARETADAALDTRITNVKEYLEKQTSNNYVSKADAAVQDGAVVKAANTIGENVTNLDAALAKETAARIGADAAQDKVIEQVNQNMADGFNTINKNMADGFTALNQADAKEAQERAAADAALDDKITAETSARVAADTKLVEAVNSGLSLSNDNVLQKNTTTIDAQGNVTTSKTDANKMILNKGRDNQITLNEKGIKVGTNSTVVDKDGVYTGGDTYSEAKAAMSADGKIKGANGDFTVDENGNVTSKATITGETVTDGKGASMINGTVTGKTLTDGIATITNGNINTSGSITGGTVTSTGNISALGDIHAGGAITGASASIQGALTAGSATITGDLTAGGAIQGKSISDGTATMQNGNLTGVKNLSAETITTSGDATIGGDLTVNGKLNVDEIDLTKNGIVGDNNVTASTKVAAGEIKSYKKAIRTKDGSEKDSAIDYDENGTSTWAKATDADGNWKKSTLTVEGSDVTSKVVDSDKNSNESQQTSQESSDVVKDANGNTSTFSQRVKDILQEIKNAAGDTLTKVEQTDTAITSQIGDGSAVKSEMTADGITNTAVGGTITNSAKDLVNTATGDMTNTVGGKMLNNVTGDMENKVGGSQTTTVTGDSSLTAENITNEARNKITNKALDVETDASSSIVNKVSNDAGSNTSTQLSYQTTEEMSQADGKKASYLRGAAEEKSQLTDGDKKTTIDTIAGQTNTNITDGTNTSNDLQKADQIASSVTDGTNTTVVNQNAGSLASSITDGAKVNNSSNTVDKSEQLIKASDTQYSATSKTATKMEDALVSGGSFIDVIKNLDDAANPFIGSAVTDGTNSTGVTQTAKDITNTAKNGTIANDAKNITNTAAEKLSNKAADIENLASSSILNKVGDNVSSKLETDKITTVVKDGSKSNTVTETASASKQQMVSGKIIDILKDAEHGYVNTTVKTSDESSSTSVNQETENITSTAKQGTITNDAKNLVNKAAESITNTAGTQIQDVVGKSTVTITDTGTTFENTEHAAPIGEGSIKQTTISGNTLETGKATADYVDVNKDLHVKGSTKLDGTLEVAGKSTFKDDVTMDENLEVKGTTTTDKLVVNNGANITGGTTTDTLHVTNTATFDGMVTFKDAVSMEKDLSVGGSATVTGDVTAKSYKVGDKTYINQNGINANGQKITNVADGTIAERSTDAVNGGQLNATNQRVTTVENRMDGVENRMDRVENRVDNLDNRIDKVGASAAAMANLHPMDFDEDSKVSVAAAMGSYRSETAGALGVFYRPTDRVMMNVSTSFGNGENMIGGGVSFKLGKSSKRLEKAEATNAALVKQVTNLQNRLDALLGVLNPNLSKAFPDVPANHWAYEAVSRLAGNDIIQGYEDGKYHGERTMTRYEMAEIIYNALSKGAKAEAKLVEEFRPELQAMAAQRKA